MTKQIPSSSASNGLSRRGIPLLRPTRRTLLTGTTAAVSMALISRYGRASQSGTPFTLGVASGAPTSDGVVLWTRLAPEPLAPDGSGGITEAALVTWEIAADEAMRQVVQRGTVEADRRLAHSVHVEVAGLQPNRPYWYRFIALGAESPIGRTRTAPAATDNVDHLRFAFASCSHYELGYFSAYRHMAADDPDLVLFLGDYIYEYTVSQEYADRTVRKHDGPTAVDLVGYRNRYALHRTDPDLQTLHAAAPCLVTWDDHEVENDYANEWSQVVATTPEAFLRRRAAAYQAYYEHMPLRARSLPHGSTLRLHDRIRFGNLVTFSVLDGRQYRSQQPCARPDTRRGYVAPDSCTERVDENRTLLGFEQERWLFDGFKTADTAWNVLAQNQLIAQLRQKGADGVVGHWTEGWDGYAAGRRRMLEAIDQTRLTNPVFIGGDIHSFWATDLKADLGDPTSKTIATEFVGTSITSDGPPYQRFMEMLPENPHVRFFDSRQRGYVRVDLTRRRMETSFLVISDRRDPKATVSTMKRFVVENGKPGGVAD
ncbi:alkaline phosphatase D family protein [Hyphomicrobium sp. CS1BSMeth3]|uniref:alkaline phosphatase D family protein n=1 Tax=Hyphomicrobium sp. CS1BSMeth3 TaxID=1892844 RepID=UPI000930A45B|nr:alkaline phosphatase D family protein [Hyphomicrobium sp. CS1BSMeth3]